MFVFEKRNKPATLYKVGTSGAA